MVSSLIVLFIYYYFFLSHFISTLLLLLLLKTKIKNITATITFEPSTFLPTEEGMVEEAAVATPGGGIFSKNHDNMATIITDRDSMNDNDNNVVIVNDMAIDGINEIEHADHQFVSNIARPTCAHVCQRRCRRRS